MSIHITDIVAGVGTVTTAVLMEPVYSQLLSDFEAQGGTLLPMMTALFVPFIFIGIIISIGVSARRAGS